MVWTSNVSHNAKRPKLQQRRKRLVVAAGFFRDVINPQLNRAIKRFIQLHVLAFFDCVAFAKSLGPDLFWQAVVGGTALGRTV
jgi:hypothetical protein